MREKLLREDWIENAVTVYSFVKGMESQNIIVNEKSELIKQAFIRRANAMTYEQIIEKLKHLGLNMPKQTLGGILKNPFYCGFMSNNLSLDIYEKFSTEIKTRKKKL